jgi:adenylate cyclase
MSPEKFKRKLTAILSADVKGYSRLMGEDEEGTIRTLNAYLEAIAGFVQKHQGRIVGTAGDSMLAEFASVVDAVRCAVEVQNELKYRNADLPETRRMEFRIGINLGDVIEEGEQIYGDGVNIAARLESLAEAGGICISGTVYEHVEKKLSLGYEYLGEQAVKNITKPVRVYRVLMEPEAAGKVIGEKKGKPRQWQRMVFPLGIILFVVVAAVGAWRFYLRPASHPKMDISSVKKMAFPLPDVPSIAVLPFVNMSEDPKQEFLGDAITESIIMALSKVPRLFVIARDSTSTYKGKPVKVKQVSEELGVRYVLEGSVQRSGDRVRITAQLIDALIGIHLWAERYDRDLKDIFALQDEITLKILVATQVKLTEGELSLGVGKHYRGKQGLDCYLKIMEGIGYVDRFTSEDNNLARRIAGEVIAMCPEVPMAYRLMAAVYQQDFWLSPTKSPAESIEKGIAMIQKALALDDTFAEGHSVLSVFYLQKREYDKAIAEGERAVALNPSGATILAVYAQILQYAGRSEEAIPLYQKAIRLNPHGPIWYYETFGVALLMTGRYEEAVLALKKTIQHVPNYMWAHLILAATYVKMGREKEARAEAAEVLRINPKFSIDFVEKRSLTKDQSARDNFSNALRKAGLK